MKAQLQKDFLCLIEEHKSLLLKICHIYGKDEGEKQDLFQEIVIQLWKSFDTFRGDSKITTWMYRIALNTALTDLRKRKSKITISYREDLPNEIKEEKYDHSKEEKLAMLYEAIKKLTEIEKAIITLYLEEKTYEEMEEVLGISQGTLRVKVNRIKEKLRQFTKGKEYGT
ncbi:MAG: RNA polymerase sigma factor [Chitinophagaceae bacterium]